MLFEAFGLFITVRRRVKFGRITRCGQFVHQAGTLFDVGNISILLFDVSDIDKVMTLLHNE